MTTGNRNKILATDYQKKTGITGKQKFQLFISIVTD